MYSSLLSVNRCTSIVFIFLLICSCSGDHFFPDEAETLKNEVLHSPDAIDINGDIEIVNEVITLLPFNFDNKKSAGILKNHFVLRHIANIPVPDSGKEEMLSASSLFISKEYDGEGVRAFIGYNTRGDSARGGLKIIEYVDELNNRDKTVLFDADVNDIYVEGNTAYLACSDYNLGAVVYTVDINTYDVDTAFIISDFFDGDIPPSANGIAPLNGKLAVSAGRKHGGAFVINKGTTEFEKDFAYFSSNAKSIATNKEQDEIALLIGGDEAKLVLISPTGELLKSIDLNTNIEFRNVEEEARYSGKAQIRYLNESLIIATLGKHDAVVINTESGELSETSEDMLTEGNTNSVSWDNVFVYYANGADGLYLADFSDGEPEELVDPEWMWNTEAGMPPGSVNSVESDGSEWIVVAKGLNGVHLLRLEECKCDQDEVPECSETAFAYKNPEPDGAACFIEEGFNRWGWTIPVSNPGDCGLTVLKDLPLYAGAGQCDTNKGKLAGTLTVTYDGSTVTAVYNLTEDYSLDQVHFYAGNGKYPLKNGVPTVAPGQFPYIAEGLCGKNHTATIENLCGNIYIIAHASVHVEKP